MKYKGYEIRANVQERTIYSLTEDGQLDKPLYGRSLYRAVQYLEVYDSYMGLATSFDTVQQCKAYIDEQVKLNSLSK